MMNKTLTKSQFRICDIFPFGIQKKTARLNRALKRANKVIEQPED